MRKIPLAIVQSFKMIKFYTGFASGVALVMDMSLIRDTAIRFSLLRFLHCYGNRKECQLINDFSPLYSYSLVFLLFNVRFLKDNQT